MTQPEEVLDGPQPTSDDDRALIEWWERKRWWYNVLVGVTGLMVLGISGALPRLLPYEWAAIVMYGILANIGYTMGWASHFLLQHYFQFALAAHYRQALYFVGTVGSILLTYWLARWYVFDWLFNTL